MEVVEAYQVTVSEYSKLRRKWNHQSIYFGTVSTDEYHRKRLAKVRLLKTEKGYFPLPEPTVLIQ
jgi:hypothetical protein